MDSLDSKVNNFILHFNHLFVPNWEVRDSVHGLVYLVLCLWKRDGTKSLFAPAVIRETRLAALALKPREIAQSSNVV